MKTTIYLIAVLLLLAACSKNNDEPSPAPATKTKEELLTQHVWKMEEIIQVENNNQINYKRGGSTYTYNFDNDKLTFLANGNGTYSPTPTQLLNLTWQFTNTDKTKMNIVITFSPTVVLTLKCSEVELSDNRFFCVNNYTNTSSQPVLSSVYRTPL
ncbi:MAG: hypothetical protein ACSLE0_05755 [Chitinophagaceae bacterium]